MDPESPKVGARTEAETYAPRGEIAGGGAPQGKLTKAVTEAAIGGAGAAPVLHCIRRN